jgi:hypothetical protein
MLATPAKGQHEHRSLVELPRSRYPANRHRAPRPAGRRRAPWASALTAPPFR